MPSGPWTYDVALSFAGEDRALALDLATRLHAAGYRVFFDRFEELWGQDLAVKLQEVYGQQSRYCVVLVSQHYLGKPWTNHERRILLSRAMKQAEPCLLPIRVDGSELPGLSDLIAYKDLRVESMGSILDSLRALIGPPNVAASAETSPRRTDSGLALYPSDFLYGVVHLDSPQTARFNIACHLINGSDRALCLHRLEATVTPAGERGLQFMWHAAVDIGPSYMQESSDALPYALGPGESRLLGAQFIGPRLETGLLWRAGELAVEIVGWVDRPARAEMPDLHARFAVTVDVEESWMMEYAGDLPLGVLKPVAVAVPMSIDPAGDRAAYFSTKARSIT